MSIWFSYDLLLRTEERDVIERWLIPFFHFLSGDAEGKEAWGTKGWEEQRVLQGVGKINVKQDELAHNLERLVIMLEEAAKEH
jgi:hypothetical protein